MPRLIELMRAEMKNTKASGAKITTHLKALWNMNWPKARHVVVDADHVLAQTDIERCLVGDHATAAERC